MQIFQIKKKMYFRLLYLGFWCWPNVFQVRGKFNFFSTTPFYHNKSLVFRLLLCEFKSDQKILSNSLGIHPCDTLSSLHSASLSPIAEYINLLHHQILPNKQSLYELDIFVDIEPDCALLFPTKYRWNSQSTGSGLRRAVLPPSSCLLPKLCTRKHGWLPRLRLPGRGGRGRRRAGAALRRRAARERRRVEAAGAAPPARRPPQRGGVCVCGGVAGALGAERCRPLESHGNRQMGKYSFVFSPGLRKT